jgi:integrase/recombinase XerD
MRPLKHLPETQWPTVDRAALEAAFKPGDLFDESGGPGAHLAEGSRRFIHFAYRRWLGFLQAHHPDDLVRVPADRISLERVRDFIDHLTPDMRPTSMAITVERFYCAARLIDPDRDWQWLAAITARLLARARPQDRFHRLVPPAQTLDFGIELMDHALTLPITGHKTREIQYRDGLLLALLSLWPIRRRSVAALTVNGHIEIDDGGLNFLLNPADTKSKRFESFRVPEPLVPYVKRYLKEIRPRLLGDRAHDGFWASFHHQPLTAGRLYDIARARLMRRFGKDMCLHDFRRAAATHLAMEAPGQVGLIPGLLQHTTADVGERHYNLANAIKASQRFAIHLANARSSLRPLSVEKEG